MVSCICLLVHLFIFDYIHITFEKQYLGVIQTLNLSEFRLHSYLILPDTLRNCRAAKLFDVF